MPIPSATYRLQMHAGFTLRDATAILPYLDSLGISHVYTSSLLAAKPGSTHGYDVIDHSRINPEVGTSGDLEAFSSELHTRNMGLILDVVPNHMSIGGPNAWWRDVLENGPSSRYANYFDIAWNDHHREPLRGKVLLPILGTPYGESLDGGEWRIEFENGAFVLVLPEARLPIDPRTYGGLLEPFLEVIRLREPQGEELPELQSIAAAVRHLPARTEGPHPEAEAEIVVIKRRLKEWAARDDQGLKLLVEQLDSFSKNLAALDQLVDLQAYRPCYWRVATDEINYRRFFDVNDLAALATERLEVFDDVHRLIFEWLERGIVDGLRIDHPDGLYDPKGYLDRLQERWRNGVEKPPLYVVVEKILAPRETLRSDWATAGTTGYDFLNAVNGLFIDPAAEETLTRFYEEFTGQDEAFHDVVYRSKFLILQSSLTSELHVLAGHFDRLAQMERRTRDLTLNGLRHALRELLASFPRYRTYTAESVSDEDRAVVNKAVRQARRRNPLLGCAVFDFLRDTLLLKETVSDEYRAAQIRCVGKFQQLAAPVMAKGLEDTAFYRYNRFISLNEVGGAPSIWSTEPADLHAFLQSRPRGSLSTLATHDTKRGEDVRARLNAITLNPAEWERRVRRWSELNEPHRVKLDDRLAPDRNEEYLLYQTLVGAWPGSDEQTNFRARIQDYMTKTLQEAKVYTSWINPDADYVDAIRKFVALILDPDIADHFLKDLEEYVDTLRSAGQRNSLAQCLLRCMAPGIPDVYQGNEFEDLHLVDPDNRQPVDYSKRRSTLEELDASAESPSFNVRKLHVLSRALRYRRSHAQLFAKGDYVALWPNEAGRNALFAFLLHDATHACLVAIPRWMPPDPQSAAVVLPPAFQECVWTSELSQRVVKVDCGRIGWNEFFRDDGVSLLSADVTRLLNGT